MFIPDLTYVQEAEFLNEVEYDTEYIADVEVQDEEFWMQDSGLVIIIADDTKFRVLRSVLERHSIIFGHLFTLPQPTEDSFEDGCPVVRLHESAVNVRHMLKALMPNLEANMYVHRPPLPPTYEMVSACIRLGYKYESAKLCQQGVAFLKSKFPTNFDNWCDISDNVAPPGFHPTEAIGVVKLARLFDEDPASLREDCGQPSSLLPTALLVCTRLDEEELRSGLKHDDGTLVTLSEYDLERVQRVKNLLPGEIACLVVSAFRPPVDGKKPAHCWSADNHCECVAQEAFWAHVGYDRDRLVPWNPFFSWDEFHDTFAKMGKYMCTNCDEHHENQLLDAQYKLWKRLPELFDVDVPEGWLNGRHGNPWKTRRN
ncbi:hypothetical protein K466DRAFT_621900 [Polyporus arcularius HHB13444]|uniref:BTB domain-containing protein n=1 Tax=Polyporus arcularius HHB13444 TaxID=1314778 RepID=A0A5C3P7D1_9APHY|nr:hypothetical protein K466DRAFT_621900 [Polyporus arcularius HHB13444]